MQTEFRYRDKTYSTRDYKQIELMESDYSEIWLDDIMSKVIKQNIDTTLVFVRGRCGYDNDAECVVEALVPTTPEEREKFDRDLARYQKQQKAQQITQRKRDISEMKRLMQKYKDAL